MVIIQFKILGNDKYSEAVVGGSGSDRMGGGNIRGVIAAGKQCAEATVGVMG